MFAGLLEPVRRPVAWWRKPGGAMGEPGRSMAFVFQEPTLMPWARVQRTCACRSISRGVPRAESDARVARGAGSWSACDQFADAYPRELSGGMQMRVSIARGLVVAAEPAADGRALRRARRVHAQPARQRPARAVAAQRLTVVFVTHSIYEAVFLSSRVIVMAARPGRVIDEVPIDEPYPRGDGLPRLARRSSSTAACCPSTWGARTAASAERPALNDRPIGRRRATACSH